MSSPSSVLAALLPVSKFPPAAVPFSIELGNVNAMEATTLSVPPLSKIWSPTLSMKVGVVIGCALHLVGTFAAIQNIVAVLTKQRIVIIPAK